MVSLIFPWMRALLPAFFSFRYFLPCSWVSLSYAFPSIDGHMKKGRYINRVKGIPVIWYTRIFV